VLTDRSRLSDGQDRGVIGTQTWRLADLASKHMLLREGIGWGYMPEPMVRDDLEGGRLVQLDLPEYKDGLLRLHAIHRTDTPPGPAGSWLIAGSWLRRKGGEGYGPEPGERDLDAWLAHVRNGTKQRWDGGACDLLGSK
jgi:DNA-binding transcriptional LysR family regulator